MLLCVLACVSGEAAIEKLNKKVEALTQEVAKLREGKIQLSTDLAASQTRVAELDAQSENHAKEIELAKREAKCDAMADLATKAEAAFEKGLNFTRMLVPPSSSRVVSSDSRSTDTR